MAQPFQIYTFVVSPFAACQKVYKATIQIDPEMNQYNIKNEEYSTTMSLFTIG